MRKFHSEQCPKCENCWGPFSRCTVVEVKFKGVTGTKCKDFKPKEEQPHGQPSA